MASDVTNYLKRIYDLIESQSVRLQRGTPPILLDASTNDTGTKIVLTYNKIMSQYMFSGIAGAFVASSKTVVSVSRGSKTNTIELTLNTAYINGDSITLAYDASIALESIDLGLAELFTATSVTNSVPE